jgi:hypothetical protein
MRHFIFKQAQRRRALIMSALSIAAMGTLAISNVDVINVCRCCGPATGVADIVATNFMGR